MENIDMKKTCWPYDLELWPFQLTFYHTGSKTLLCVLKDELLSAEDELFPGGRTNCSNNIVLANTGGETISAGKNAEKYAISTLIF